MAAGLTAALARLQAVIEGVRSSPTAWVRSTQRLSTLDTPEGLTVVDYKYWLELGPRNIEHPVVGSLVDHRWEVTVELARAWGGPDMLKGDDLAMMKTIEAQAVAVEHSLLNMRNWATSTTGIVLINLRPGQAFVFKRPMVLWTINLDVTLRIADATVLV